MNRLLAIISLALLLVIPNIVYPTCFYREETISGLNKICYYDCLSGTAAITVNALDLCPLNFPED